MKQTVGNDGIGMLDAVKKYLDPSNVFASNNLIPSKAGDNEEEASPAQHVMSKL